ncbi:uncharacterized protein LOC126906722 isoform X2 [Daktulosphaira vitifoliae]|uniref:uncharacterized protein LOC126906722 isoform X2 n=1 Tax=Daktulosphaira vitifoliae TaxID=58002 RepID=UPI0021A986F7|nr:uncharacterized protein LOC126906722 isoform X2 [Daktulosphaira vitifoliae]XP_050543445.1 uncharacterized protein LOC126906722 isoform X2 [Daktulosphaira vitifoliae]
MFNNVLNSSDSELMNTYRYLSLEDIEECRDIFNKNSTSCTNIIDEFLSLLRKHKKVNKKLKQQVQRQILNEPSGKYFNITDMYYYLNLHIQTKCYSSTTSSSTFSLSKVFSCSSSKNTID